MPTIAPRWVTPETKWIDCMVEGLLEPEGYAVQIRVNGHDVTAVVPEGTVSAPRDLPAEGWVRVSVVAVLGDDNVLADLPTAPLNGTQRITVQGRRLTDR
jgi:hypothetical protein